MIHLTIGCLHWRRYKYTEHKVAMKKVGEKIGMSSAEDVKRDALAAFMLYAGRKKELKALAERGAQILFSAKSCMANALRFWIEGIETQRWVAGAKIHAVGHAVFVGLRRGFLAWLRVVTNEKMATEMWEMRCKGHAWDIWMDGMQEYYDLIDKVNEKCKNVVAQVRGDAARTMFLKWSNRAKKRRAAVEKARHSVQRMGFDLWAELLAEYWAVMGAVREKCGRVVAMIRGQMRDECFAEWRDSVAKDKRARARFKHASLWMCLTRWRDEAKSEAHNKRYIGPGS